MSDDGGLFGGAENRRQGVVHSLQSTGIHSHPYEQWLQNSQNGNQLLTLAAWSAPASISPNNLAGGVSLIRPFSLLNIFPFLASLSSPAICTDDVLPRTRT